MKWYGVFVSEIVAIDLVRLCNINGILTERAGGMVWYKAREIDCEMICRWLEDR